MEQPTGILYVVAWLISLPMLAVTMWCLIRYIYVIAGYIAMMEFIPRTIPFVGGIAGSIALYLIPIPGLALHLSYPIKIDFALWIICGFLNVIYFRGKGRNKRKRAEEQEVKLESNVNSETDSENQAATLDENAHDSGLEKP